MGTLNKGCRLLRLLVVAASLLANAPAAHAAWQQGSFDLAGKKVTEYHCAPKTGAKAPAIIMLHGAGPQGQDHQAAEPMCESLAEHGYFAEYIEYYSLTGPVEGGQLDKFRANFPAWMGEIWAGVQNLQNNPAVDSNRIGLLGFSLGANLALAFAALNPGGTQAVVEYYGWLPSKLESRADAMPPVLILHGAKDELVPTRLATRLDALLTQNKRPHEMKIYDDAGHGFNFQNPQSADSKDAWARTLAFFDKYLKKK